jgi:cell division protein FtsQ
MSAVGLKTAKITMDERRAWTLYFVNDMQVKLGRANSDERLQRFVRVFKAGLNNYQSEIVAVDMRYTNGLSVIWKQGHKPDFYGTI